MLAEMFIFDTVKVIPERWELYRDGQLIKLEPKVFDTLLVLIRHAGQPVSKDELLSQVWPDTIANESSLSRNISVLRAALDPNSPDRYIRTFRNGGYALYAEVQSTTCLAEEKPIKLAEVTKRENARPKRHRNWLVFIGTLLITFVILGYRMFPPGPKPVLALHQLTTDSAQSDIHDAVIAPFGNIVAYATSTQIIAQNLHTGNNTYIPIPGSTAVTRLEWFSDGVRLLVSGFDLSTSQQNLFVLSTLDRNLDLMQTDAAIGVPSPDGSMVAFVRNNNQLWVSNSDGSNSRIMAKAFFNGSSLGAIRFSEDGKYIFASFINYDDNHSSIESYRLDSGETKEVLKLDTPILDYLPLDHGAILISRVKVSSTIENDVVIVKDASHISDPILTPPPGYVYRGFSVSADRKIVVFIQDLMQSDVYVARLIKGQAGLQEVKRLTLNDRSDRPAAWLDNQTVLFYSDRDGHYNIYKQSINDDSAENLTNSGELDSAWPVVTADRRWMFYFAVNNPSSVVSVTLMRKPLAGGKPEAMESSKDMTRSMRCALANKNCVVAERTDDGRIFYLFEPDSGQKKLVARVKWIPGVTYYDWDLSPDGMLIAYLDYVSGSHHIRIIPVENGINGKNIEVAAKNPLRTLMWDAEGSGFYISTYDGNSQNMQLNHVSLNREVTVMLRDPTGEDGWAIPSPDGNYLAFQKFNHKTHLWLMKRDSW